MTDIPPVRPAGDEFRSGLTETSGYGMIMVDDLGPCAICESPTRCMDVGFETYICSIECCRQILAEFDEANRRTGPLYEKEP
jgi:hypothetical protein